MSVGRNSIECPGCTVAGGLHIVDGRWSRRRMIFRRRYRCKLCGHRFTTFEPFREVLYVADPAEDSAIERFFGAVAG